MKKPKPRKLSKAERMARELRQRVAHERALPRGSARENHLRSLMGLPSAPAAAGQVADEHPPRRIEKSRGRARK